MLLVDEGDYAGGSVTKSSTKQRPLLTVGQPSETATTCEAHVAATGLTAPANRKEDKLHKRLLQQHLDASLLPGSEMGSQPASSDDGAGLHSGFQDY